MFTFLKMSSTKTLYSSMPTWESKYTNELCTLIEKALFLLQ